MQVCWESERVFGWSQKLLWGSFEDGWIWHPEAEEWGQGWSPSLPNAHSASFPWMLLLWTKHTWGDLTHLYQRQHWLCCLLFLFYPLFNFMPYVNFKPWNTPGSHISDHIELIHTPSSGLLALQHPVQLPDLHPSPTLTWRVEESLRPKGTEQPANPSPFFSAVALGFSIYCVPGDVHTSSLILTKFPRVGSALLISVGKSSETIINQALSASGFELGSCSHQIQSFLRRQAWLSK